MSLGSSTLGSLFMVGKHCPPPVKCLVTLGGADITHGGVGRGLASERGRLGVAVSRAAFGGRGAHTLDSARRLAAQHRTSPLTQLEAGRDL